jgi:hypothetical protein
MHVSGGYYPNELLGISQGKGDVQLPSLVGLAESMKARLGFAVLCIGQHQERGIEKSLLRFWNSLEPKLCGAQGADPTNTLGGPIAHLGIRTSRLDHVWETARRFGAKLGEEPTSYTLHKTSGQGPIVVRLCFIQRPSGDWIELIENAP